MKQLHTYSTNVLAIIGILSIIGFMLMLTSCESSSTAPSDEKVEEKLNVQEQALINNVGELHNYAIKKLYEKHREEIEVMLSSREGIEKMADIMIKEAKASEFWTLAQDESFSNKEEIVSAIVNIFSGNYEQIENYSNYNELLLFNLDNLPEWSRKYPTLEAYKKDIPRISNVIQTESPKVIEDILINTVEASSSLWTDQDLVYAFSSGSITNQVKKENFIHFPNPDFSKQEASEATCAIMTTVADAEGGAIGLIGGGPIGSIIGAALGSVVFIHASSNAGVCYTD
jgi:hypothetical protein